ncbi:MAG: hypothetical protein V1799_02850 [bacterium]
MQPFIRSDDNSAENLAATLLFIILHIDEVPLLFERIKEEKERIGMITEKVIDNGTFDTKQELVNFTIKDFKIIMTSKDLKLFHPAIKRRWEPL